MKSLNYRNFSLTKFVRSAGCAAKIDPEGLNKSVASLLESSKSLISSTTSNEDASVFKLSQNLALVQTLDFITPVCDDPFIFGQIAAANALSDVFAMGAKVINALNIIGFDACHFSSEIMAEILAGGKDKVVECGGEIVGGHSIETPENYYGLSVTGIVHPDKFWANNTAKVGDILILTKPIGMGVLTTSIKGDFLTLDEIKEAIFHMSHLNYYAINALKNLEVNACTDITGFGLLGHASEMLNSQISFEIFKDEIPILKSAKKYANLGLFPAGAYRNFEFIKEFCAKKPDLLLADPQTSGGLLLAVSQKDSKNALLNLKNAGYEKASIIGVVRKKDELESRFAFI